MQFKDAVFICLLNLLLRVMQREIPIDEENKTEIAYVMPIEDAEYLIKAGYLHGYTHGTNKMTAGVDCRFIVDHYFDMKKRVK